MASTPLKFLLQNADGQPGHAFRYLHVNAPFPAANRIDVLELIAPFCYHLTITFKPRNGESDPRANESEDEVSNAISLQRDDVTAQPLRRNMVTNSTRDDSSSMRSSQTFIRRSFSRWSSARSHRPFVKPKARAPLQASCLPELPRHGQEEAMEQWIHIFQRCRQLQTLTFRILGDTAWPGFNTVGNAIVTVRCALDSLENHDLPHLKSVRISPATAMSILHLRWDGLAAFGQPRIPRTTKSIHLWQSLETLELRLRSPFSPATQMSEHQRTMFLKSLDAYLRSFAPTIQRLYFRWLDGEGPAPLTLHFEEALRNRPAIKWEKLIELRLGDTTQLYHSVCAAEHVAPKLDRISMLRFGTKPLPNNEQDAQVDEAGAWHNVLFVQDRMFSRAASSVYSQTPSGQRPSELLSGGVSRTSLEVTFMLDLNGRWSQLPPGASLDGPSESEMVEDRS